MVEMQPLMHYVPLLLIAVGYGFIFGLIPVAGVKLGLIALYPYADLFLGDPYSMVIMIAGVFVSASIGDMFASICMNIPGGGGSTATMLDGFPMSKRGEATRALSAGLFGAVSQAVLWGGICILMLPFYANFVMYFGIPEMFLLCVLAMTAICFTGNNYPFRGILACGLGVLVGMTGEHPMDHQVYRFVVFDWEYIKQGYQIIPVMAGILAVPEILEHIRTKITIPPSVHNNWQQIKMGFKDWWKHKWDSVKGGAIGTLIGAIPGLGGSISEWLAYAAVSARPKPTDTHPFGMGNVRGVIGVEGANLAQKAAVFVPTILFGIPGAAGQVIVMALLAYVGMDLGSTAVLDDPNFFKALGWGWMCAVFVTFFLAILFFRWATLLLRIPFYFWGPLLIGIVVWASMQHTGTLDDLWVLLIFVTLGMGMKHGKFNRIAFVIGFILSAKVEQLGFIYFQLYGFTDLFTRPISAVLVATIVSAIVYGLYFNKTRIQYT
jgi:TctA family transporter